MKLLGNFINKFLDLLFKRSRSGEKQQDIEVKKINSFNKCLSYIALAFLILLILNALIPALNLSDWHYNVFEKIITYMMGVEQ